MLGSTLSALARAYPLGADDGRLGRVNNFDALRLLAALAVLVSHAFVFAGEEEPRVGTLELGFIAVYMFFGISGFLIAQSWSIEPHLWRYLAKRALRIFPALIVLLILTVLVLGPAFTTLPLRDYLASGDTWKYLFNNSVLALEHELPGVFATNPYPAEVNGSLWTLGPEMFAYFGLAALGVIGGLRRKWVAPIVAVLLLGVPHDPTGLIPWTHQIWLLQAFAVAISLYILRDHIPWHGGIALLLVGAFALAPSEGTQLLLAATAIPYVTIWVAYRGPAVLRRLATRGDFSYGIYLYAWPVGQAVAAILPDATALVVTALSLPVTFALGIASWNLVEKPALVLKKSLRGRSAEPRVDPGPPMSGTSSPPTSADLSVDANPGAPISAKDFPPVGAEERVDPGSTATGTPTRVASTPRARAVPLQAESPEAAQ